MDSDDNPTTRRVDKSLALLKETRPELANDVIIFMQFAEDTVVFVRGKS